MIPSPTRRRTGEAGFTLIETMVALFILTLAITSMQLVADAALELSVDTNRRRIAKILLARKTEEVAAGIEEGSGGSFEGYPNMSWSVGEQTIPIGETEETMRLVTVSVRYPTMKDRSDDRDPFEEVEDAPGIMRTTLILDPEDAVLNPPPGAGSGTSGGGS
ncbi:MAG: type IV pilus modification PilV family protein [Planctomycetota bacterium]